MSKFTYVKGIHGSAKVKEANSGVWVEKTHQLIRWTLCEWPFQHETFTETEKYKQVVDDQVHCTTSELKTALSDCLLLAEQYNDEAMSLRCYTSVFSSDYFWLKWSVYCLNKKRSAFSFQTCSFKSQVVNIITPARMSWIKSQRVHHPPR